ncbi:MULTISPECIES: hypothetical protein [Deefgea]|uniref:Uncharacterized protein n=1 Tax=Deefgea chitinilytica TaxID=570276 RepID=A0ABS2CEZ6_9NEIS|nr:MULTISPECIES: hypothetical protein [Deefgea]MBM5572733.1 hypothetical protein [Deefgea chitinilytica]MBM9889969.1 hypothetical protein [Deefgea sp. CFH1-16]
MQFDEIQAVHFNTLSRTPFPHVLLEQALLQLGGGGVDGSKYAKQVLAAAGWRHASVVSYGKYPEEAATAFNKIRAVLANNEDPTALIELLSKR